MRFATLIFPALLVSAVFAAPAASKGKPKPSDFSCVCPKALADKSLKLFSEENPTVDQVACDYYRKLKSGQGDYNSKVVCQYGEDNRNGKQTCNLIREYKNSKWSKKAKACPRQTKILKAGKSKNDN